VLCALFFELGPSAVDYQLKAKLKVQRTKLVYRVLVHNPDTVAVRARMQFRFQDHLDATVM